MTFKEVQSTVKPKLKEVNSGTYYIRRDIKKVKSDVEGQPDMYNYLEAEVTSDVYIAELEKELAEKQ